MAAKSAIKKHCKTLAGEGNTQLSAAASLEDLSLEGVLDLSAMTDPETVKSTVEDGIDPPTLEDLSQDGTTLSEMGAQATPSDLNERLRAKAGGPKVAEPESKPSPPGAGLGP